MLKFQFRAMGTDVHVGIYTDSAPTPSNHAELLYDVQQTVRQLEQQMSRFDAQSDVSRMNMAPNEWVSISKDTWDVLKLAFDVYDFTDGLFHPCMGHFIAQIGYTKSFEALSERVSSDAVDWTAPIEKTNSYGGHTIPPLHDLLSVSSEGPWAKIHSGISLDLGGIAKAWIVSRASQMVHKAGFPYHVVSAGGDMICSGKNGSVPWRIGIANPSLPSESVLTLDVHGLSVATSGTYKRTWSWAGQQVHHILNPRTGLPAHTDIASCTVLHENLVHAEALARSCLILGTDAGIPWLLKHGCEGYVIITVTGEVIHTWNSSENKNDHR